jgi:hypothetical protein
MSQQTTLLWAGQGWQRDRLQTLLTLPRATASSTGAPPGLEMRTQSLYCHGCPVSRGTATPGSSTTKQLEPNAPLPSATFAHSPTVPDKDTSRACRQSKQIDHKQALTLPSATSSSTGAPPGPDMRTQSCSRTPVATGPRCGRHSSTSPEPHHTFDSMPSEVEHTLVKQNGHMPNRLLPCRAPHLAPRGHPLAPTCAHSPAAAPPWPQAPDAAGTPAPISPS